MAKQIVQAIPATPPRYSLLTALQPAVDPEARWEAGVHWTPEQTLGGGITAADCDGGTDALTPDTTPEISEADPFNVWAEDHCSTIGSQLRDFEGRARRALEATQSFRIAAELWDGAIAQAAPLDNEWLTDDPAILTGAALGVDDALAILDMGLARMLGGRRGLIHCSPQCLDALEVNNAIYLSGQLWLTAMGTIVVSDAGYPGTGPAGGAHQWMYATPMINYRLGEVMLIPENLSSARAQAVDRATNTVTIRAQRLALLQWDSKTPIGSTGKKGVLAAETTVAAFTAF